MAVEWFYTTNKQQMGPVSWQELVELANGGILKPHDLVWSEGMDEWVKAIQQNGLFAESDDGGRTSVKKSSSRVKPPPGRRTSRREEDEDEEDEEEEDRESRRKKARKREEDRARTGVGIKIGLILAGVVLVLLLMCGGGGVLIWVAVSAKGGGAQKRPGVAVNPQGGAPVAGQPPAGNPPPGNPGPGGLAGTSWTGSETLTNYNRLNFRFMAGGQVVMTDADGPSNGTWNQAGNNVTLHFFNGSVTYNGTIQGNRMQGTATNGKQRWNWNVAK